MVKRRISIKRVLSSFHRIIAFRYLLVITVVSISLNSCYNEPEFLGGDIIPTSDKLLVKTDTTFLVTAHTVSTDTIPTGGYLYAILGTYNSEIFGKTKSDFLTQMSHGANKDTLYTMSPRPAADSLFLYLRLVKVWGDINKMTNLRVFELGQDMIDTTSSYKYFNGRSISVDGKYLPTQVNYPFAFNGTYDTLKIRLTQNFANKLMTAPDSSFISNGKFVKFMKGLYITSDGFSETGGAIFAIDYNVRMVLHYHYYSSKTKRDSLRTLKYYTGTYFARYNHITKDYSTAQPDMQINHRNDTTIQDSVFYISGLGGTRGLIKLRSISEWMKKMPISINRAELQFGVQEHPRILKDSTIFPLMYYGYRDVDTSNIKRYTSQDNDLTVGCLSDYELSKNQTTSFKKAKNYYSIDITVHLQNMLKGQKKSNYFYLEPSDFKSYYKEGVFRTGKNSQPMKLIITYSKL